MTMGNEIFPFPAMLESEQDKLDELGEKTDRDGDNEYSVLLNKVLHMPLV